MGGRLNYSCPRGHGKTVGVVDGSVKTGTAHPNRRGRHRDWWTVERDAKLAYVMEKYGDIYKAARVLGVPVFRAVQRIKTLQFTGQLEKKFYVPKDRPHRGPVDYVGDGGKKKRLAIIRECAARLKARKEAKG